MCQFCTQHGEGKKWYENMKNYSEEVFYQVNSDERFRKYLTRFKDSISTGPYLALKWKKRLPLLYRLLGYPLISNQLKKHHFGQIIPIEDVEKILDRVSSIVRLPCVCRKVTTGREVRCCFGIGMDMTSFFKDIPDFKDFEVFSREEAKKLIRQFDQDGLVHSIWTFNTPFIGALCNCDQNCMAYNVQVTMGVARAMWKGEYIAQIDGLQCYDCGSCQKYCSFKAIAYDSRAKKYFVNISKCYGCGVCRAACSKNAISLTEREIAF